MPKITKVAAQAKWPDSPGNALSLLRGLSFVVIVL
jgi:hypothetical protein